MSSDDTDAMGYNPHRRRVAKKGDLALVVVAVAIALGLVLWALLG
jgi:hypothetical protein